MMDLFKRLSTEFCAKQLKDCIKIVIPLVINTSGTLLELKIKQKDNGYVIYCPTNIFLEKNVGGSQEFYYNIFEKYDNNYHYDIKIKNGKIFKEYEKESNIAVSINEFIRLFIMLDDFIINNNVIGNEGKFI